MNANDKFISVIESDNLNDFIKLPGTSKNNVIRVIKNVTSSNKELVILKHIVNNNLDKKMLITNISVGDAERLYTAIHQVNKLNVLKYFTEIGIKFSKCFYCKYGNSDWIKSVLRFSFNDSDYVTYFCNKVLTTEVLLQNTSFYNCLSKLASSKLQQHNNVIPIALTKIFETTNVDLCKKIFVDTPMSKDVFLVLHNRAKHKIINKLVDYSPPSDSIKKLCEYKSYLKYYERFELLINNLTKIKKFTDIILKVEY